MPGLTICCCETQAMQADCSVPNLMKHTVRQCPNVAACPTAPVSSFVRASRL